MSEKHFIVIGIPDSESIELTAAQQSAIERCRCFSGGLRHHNLVHHFLPAEYQWINITAPVDTALEAYQKASDDLIVVFASGDPLFHGFANTLCNRLPDAQIEVYPYFNSLQLLAQHFLLPYQKMHVVSLVGHPWPALDRELIEGAEMIGILTDRQHQPADIARRMLDYGYNNYEIMVGERVGHEQLQRFTRSSVKEIANQESFGTPNNLILKRLYSRPRPFGIHDEDLKGLPGRANMITKMPIRLLALSMLDLRDKHTMWDVGFCTGSVSIEAKLQFPHLHIEAFEKRIESEELIKHNSKLFGTPDIRYHIGDFMEADLSVCLPPDAVFLGGYGGKMQDVLERIDAYLPTGGCIVFNSVSPKSYTDFIAHTVSLHYRLEQDILITVDEHNPIHCLKAVKP